jgi:hypothetical protein
MTSQKYSSLIVESEIISVLKNTFASVFRTTNGFDSNLFCNHITKRLILYPTDNLWLTEIQYNSLITTLKQMNEDYFYVSELSCNSFQIERKPNEYCNKHWQCDISCSYENYSSMELLLDNAIYSATGEWGVWLSNECSGAIGGKNSFMEQFQSNYPCWQNDVKLFYEEGINITWIYGYLKQFQTTTIIQDMIKMKCQHH